MNIEKGRAVAKKFIELGLNPVPVAIGSKVPLRKNFKSKMYSEEVDDFDFEEIGISTGITSGGLEALDFDLKNAEDPSWIMSSFEDSIPKELLDSLVKQETISGGYHYIYRCSEISSSKKLAKNAKGEAVIETRGEGGYIKCAPSKGYKVISDNKMSNIPIIEPKDRNLLFTAAFMLCKTSQKDASKRMSKEDLEAFKRFPEYNNDPEIGISLLEKHGWRVIKDSGEWISLTRPNTKSGDVHAGYNKEGKFLRVFSTSQDTFEVERPYNNHAIYAELECEGMYNVAYAKLYEEGHGVELDPKENDDSDDWKVSIDSLSFLSDPIEENTYLEQARKGEITQGLSTGWDVLDKNYLLKENTLDFGLGFDGVGKSILMLSIAQASNVLHDWKWGMIMPENKTAMSRRRLIETKSGRSIDSFNESRVLFSKYLEESRKNFHIMSNKRHYTISEVLEMGKKLYEFYGIKALLIDPYNFFKVSGNGYSHNNDILSKMRVFAEKYCSVFVMAHPNSDSARSNVDKDGYLTMPSKYNIQGGADFPYRVDNFFITHRIVNHQDLLARREMQIKVEKIKEVETGGKVHGRDEYTSLIYQERNNFLGYWDEDGNNPMYHNFLMQNRVKGISPQEAF